MAFVSEAERGLNLVENKFQKLGPGYYVGQREYK